MKYSNAKQNKSLTALSVAAKKNSSIQLKDNRISAIQQQKQINGLLNLPIQKKTNNTGLPNQLKSGIENLSGYSMDDVKVHYNSDKPAQLNAHAYAQGTDIHIASGQEKHLPHEAWHVVQQKQGRVKPTVQMKGKVNVNDDNGLEKEADVMGAKAQNKGKASVFLKSDLNFSNNNNKLGSEAVIQGAFFGKFLTVLGLLAVYFSRAEATFGGTYGPLMNTVYSPRRLGLEGMEYDRLWKSLAESKTNIYIEDGPPSFSPAGRKGPTLFFKGTHLQSMSKATKVFKGRSTSSRSKENEILIAEVADGLSMLTHEFSHAADSVVLGKELIGEKGTASPESKTLNIISTELTAWASEAKTVKEIGKGNVTLLNSWKNLKKNMIQSWEKVNTTKQSNEVVSRYYRYLERNLPKEGGGKKYDEWHKKHVDQVWDMMQTQKNRVLNGRKDDKEDL